MAAAAPVVGLFGSTLAGKSLEPQEEWRIGPFEDQCLTIKAWANHSISVYQHSKGHGVGRLRLTKIEQSGWRTFRGRWGTTIRLRRTPDGLFDIDYYAIIEPNRTYYVGRRPGAFRAWMEAGGKRWMELDSGLH